MKKIQLILSAALISIGLNVSANVSANDAAIDATITPAIQQNKLLSVAPCKSSADGSYTEMVTTMASVLPPAEADILLTRYCDECLKIRFNLSNNSK
jgi:hypothetical protein